MQIGRMRGWLRDRNGVVAQLTALSALHPPYAALVANMRSLEAAADALAGGADAASSFVAARGSLLGLGLRWDAAAVALDAAFTVGAADPLVAAGLLEARQLYAELRAAPYLELADALLAAAEAAPPLERAPS